MDALEPVNQVDFREASEADLPVVAEMYPKLDQFYRQFSYNFPVVENVGTLWLSSFQRTLGRFSMLHVAEYQGEIVGFMLSRLKRLPAYMGGAMVGELSDLWIEPIARRLGVGEKMLRLAIDWCHEQGVHSIEGQVLKGNEASMKILVRLGFATEINQIRLFQENYPQEMEDQ